MGINVISGNTGNKIQKELIKSGTTVNSGGKADDMQTDKLKPSNDYDKGFWSKIGDLACFAGKRQVNQENPGSGNAPNAFDSVEQGAKIGGGIGLVAGGAYGFASANSDIHKLPLNFTTQEWDSPVMRDKLLGKIPDDHTSYSSIHHSKDTECTENVIEKAPVINSDGNPKMEHITKTWTDHGKPVVEWKTKPIEDLIFKGWDERISEMFHFDRKCSGHDSQGREICHQEKHVDGYRHRFYPEIDKVKVGEYNEPVVKFDTGVDVLGRTLTCAFFGLVVGAASGALVKAVYDRIRP